MAMSNDLVDLGFLEESESWRLESYLFPSKVGGKPAWLNLENLPTAEDLQCKKCGNPMIFLCQLYAPFEESSDVTAEQSANNFHRMLYVFICRNEKCCTRNTSDNIMVLRSSLKRDNAFYSFDPPSEDRPNLDFSLAKLVSLCQVCGCFAEKKCSNCKNIYYCSRNHQILDWKESHRQECSSGKTIFKTSKVLFKEGEIVIEPEELTDFDETDLEKYQEIAKKSTNGTMTNISEEDLEAYASTEDDKIFQKFQRRIKYNPEQIIRYKRGGKPIWIAKEPLPENIPNCEFCNSERQFEFQVMPQLLTLLKENELDWGVLTVFTCKQSCTDEIGYKKEFVFKQDVEITDVNKT